MQINDSLAFISVFTAGILSFVSPCVLPLLPVYAAVLTNFDESGTRSERWRIWLNSACFLSGFTVVFMLMGVSASYFGQIFFDNQPILRKLGAAFIVLMGLQLSGILKVSLLFREYRPLLGGRFQGPAGSFFLGMAFTVGWTPCIGPVLASILVYASSADTIWQGAYLLFIYSIGFCLPFLLASMTINKWLPKYQKFYAYLPQVQRVFGATLVLTGILIYFDWVNKIIGTLWKLMG